ncbi:indolepyruvate oxidoreductase subunit beta [Acidaminobacter sp. JC074]|uniref:indolepyruvate oxidoreductase subunit beta n=1 Tax=Acidaminobacter sp. JC074 TaxID=2530199 RepID=UPI001F0D0EB8|nr:indolepyruvate oxidoreductase subunit beta [Acidaminobacter sp. JC074]MCH4886069.1 indolepyruvate oxidoreductase subunit beta [Acidaminobacter sp. JC074]
MNKSILLVGVGGQGTLLASKLLIHGLMDAGYDVKMSEIHGMSQRGGSVSSHVRFGDEVYSPVIEKGGADILVAFEKMEGLRWLSHLNPKGQAVINDFEIESMPIKTGKFTYPADVLDILKEKAQVNVVNAADEALKLGNEKVMNVILLGTLVKSMKLDHIDWESIIEELVKPKFVDLNKMAFKKGLSMAEVS